MIMPKITEAVIIFFVSCLKSYFLRSPVVQKQIFGETTKAWNDVLHYFYFFFFYLNSSRPENLVFSSGPPFLVPPRPPPTKRQQKKFTSNILILQMFDRKHNVQHRTLGG